MTERLYRRIAYPYERLACPLSNLSVTGFAVTAPLIGEPLAGRRVFGVWRFAPFGSAGVMFASAAEVGLGADRRKDRKKRPHHSKEQWGRFTILQWVPLTQPWGLREPLPPQPLRRGSAGAAGAAAGFGACFTTGLGGFGSSFSGKRMMCLGHFWAHMPQPLHLS